MCITDLNVRVLLFVGQLRQHYLLSWHDGRFEYDNFCKLMRFSDNDSII